MESLHGRATGNYHDQHQQEWEEEEEGPRTRPRLWNTNTTREEGKLGANQPRFFQPWVGESR